MNRSIFSSAAFVLAGLCIPAAAQDADGNSALNNILQNNDVQQILSSAKNNPEAMVNKVRQNPDEIVRSATAIFADQQRDKDANAVPATRSSVSQTDKSLANLRRTFASPVDPNAEPVKIPEFNVDQSQINQAKSAAQSAAQELVNKLGPIDPISRPVASQPVSAAPPMRSTPGVAPTPAPIATPRAAATPPQPSIAYDASQAPAIPTRSTEPTPQMIPDSPELFSSAAAPSAIKPRYPKPSKFRPDKDLIPASTASNQKPEDNTMVITASTTEANQKAKTIVFKGDVVVQMRGMEMKCDHLLVNLDDKQQMKEVTATGGMVEIRRVGDQKQLQIVKARKAHHVAATNVTTLSGGPPYIQNGDQYVNTDSQDSRIVLTGDGRYKIDAPKGQGRSVLVVPIAGAGKITGNLGFENKMKDLGR